MAYSHKVCLLLQLTEILADYLLGSVGIGKYFIGSFGAKWPCLAQVLHASHMSWVDFRNPDQKRA